MKKLLPWVERYTHICLDLDGTLTETAPGIRAGLEEAFRVYDLDTTNFKAKVETFFTINDAYWSRCDGGELFTYEMRYAEMEEFLQTIGESCSDVVGFSNAFSRGFALGAPLYPGVEQFLSVASRQRPLVIITNGFKEVQHTRMNSLGLSNYVDTLVTSQAVGYSKPHPEIFQVAFSAMRNPDPTKVLMIGDSLSADIGGGNAFGMDTCWVAYGKDLSIGYQAGATHVVDNLADLLAK